MAPERDKVDKTCAECRREIRRTEDALLCESGCKQWYHTKCVGIGSKEYGMIVHLGSMIIWLCVKCKSEGVFITKNPQFLQDIEENCNRLVQTVTKRITDVEEKMKENCEQMIKTVTENSSIVDKVITENCNSVKQTLTQKIDDMGNKVNKVYSYADAATSIKTKTTQNTRKFLTRKSNNTKTYIIKPKKTQTNADTQNEVQKLVNPAATGTIIETIKGIKNGGIVIKTDERAAESSNFYEILVKKLQAKYDINTIKKRNPKIKIVGVKKQYNNEDLIFDLVKQNYFIDEKDVIDIIHQFETKNNQWILIAEVAPHTFHKMINNDYVNIGWHTCRIYEDIYIKTCTRCNKYGHKKADCDQHVTCKKCGENHHFRECTNSNKQCCNCKYSNQTYKTKYNIEHEANTEDCTIHLNKISRAREGINYGENVITI